jgi:hypothetical protein
MNFFKDKFGRQRRPPESTGGGPDGGGGSGGQEGGYGGVDLQMGSDLGPLVTQALALSNFCIRFLCCS